MVVLFIGIALTSLATMVIACLNNRAIVRHGKMTQEIKTLVSVSLAEAVAKIAVLEKNIIRLEGQVSSLPRKLVGDSS